MGAGCTYQKVKETILKKKAEKNQKKASKCQNTEKKGRRRLKIMGRLKQGVFIRPMLERKFIRHTCKKERGVLSTRKK